MDRNKQKKHKKTKKTKKTTKTTKKEKKTLFFILIETFFKFDSIISIIHSIITPHPYSYYNSTFSTSNHVACVYFQTLYNRYSGPNRCLQPIRRERTRSRYKNSKTLQEILLSKAVCPWIRNSSRGSRTNSWVLSNVGIWFKY